MRDKQMLKINAHQNPSICIPVTKFVAINIITALITNEKSPSVMMVKGNPKIESTGFTTRFKTAKTTANIIAVVKLSKLIPGRTRGKKYATIAVTKSLIMNFIVLFFRKICCLFRT